MIDKEKLMKLSSKDINIFTKEALERLQQLQKEIDELKKQLEELENNN